MRFDKPPLVWLRTTICRRIGTMIRLRDSCMCSPETRSWAEYPGLRVFVPDPAYIFAMKALAVRPQDVADLVPLRSTLGLGSAAEALELVKRYVPERLLSRRVQYLIEDLFDEHAAAD